MNILRLSLLLLPVLAAHVPFAAAAAPARIVGTARVTDGDTINLGPVAIRLHGIDAPEAGQICKRANGKSWPCGTVASNRLAEIVEGQKVECEALDRDAYRRIIARCTVEGRDVNAVLIEEGLAWAFTRYSDDYAALEGRAKAAGAGIWQGDAEPAWEYRENRWQRAAEASPRPGCPIKGNINRGGEKIYHTPWSPWYDRVKINEAAGQRWFCDEEEAQAAGWRAARSR